MLRKDNTITPIGNMSDQEVANPISKEDAKKTMERIAGGVYPLSAAMPGRPVEIVELQGCKNMKSRLASMGILAGTVVRPVCNMNGPVIVEVKGARISLGYRMASKILVKQR